MTTDYYYFENTVMTDNSTKALAIVWTWVLRAVLAIAIACTPIALGAIAWTGKRIETNQLQIKELIKDQAATDREVAILEDKLEEFKKTGPRFTPEMNLTADLLVKEWARDHFVAAESIARMEEQLTSMTVNQQLILQRLAGAGINGH